MYGMFRGSVFHRDIGQWDVHNVWFMDYMFDNALNFNRDISNWCVEHIIYGPTHFSTGSLLQPAYYPAWGRECYSGIDENVSGRLILYPNPASDQFTIKSDLINFSGIDIYNSYYQQILSLPFTERAIDISALSPGLYHVVFKSDDQLVTKRLIKQ